MSTLVKSLKKQIELLQGEVELYANAVDNLAGELAEARNQLQALAPPSEVDTSQMVPAGDGEQKQPEAA